MLTLAFAYILAFTLKTNYRIIKGRDRLILFI